MERGHEQEEDLVELLQSGKDKREGPSNDGDDDREPKLESKHKIFLSHSGVQKNFTEQLSKDLGRWQYDAFFDKNPDSLPKGRKFPELIFQAARQCHVAVLILSEDFFTRTKWPMLELEAFVQSQKVKILPVYLGLSLDECTRNEIKRLRWLSVWQEWAKNDDRIDVGKWEDALKVLGPSNGIEYVQALGEVALRKKIVSAIRGLVAPEHTWSDASVQGRKRLCKALIKKFIRTKRSSRYGVRVVGIHGVGGIGKTTLCKVLCDELNVMFEGRVFPGELGSMSEIELQKAVLRQLTDTNHDSLTSTTIEMTTNLLGRRICQQSVFLALDNVWQESIEEAKIYLRAGFHLESIVMVTARSIDILGLLNIDISDCMEMPELEEEDAKCLFLHHVGSDHQFRTEDERKIQYCVRQCEFRKGVNMGRHFHPLALKVLGSQLGSLGCDPSVWVESLSKDDKFNQFGMKEHPIFSILRRGYDSLCEEDQLLFMDGILFHPPRSSFYFIGKGIYEWLSMVHQSEARVIMDRLLGLKARSLIEGIGDGYIGVIVHDLYREFAKMEAKRGALDARRWVWYNIETPCPSDLGKRPSGNCWPNVERISVMCDDDDDYIYSASYIQSWVGTMGVKWQHFSNVVVLHLVIGTNEVLDLQGLQCLRSLQLTWGKEKGQGKLIGLGELRNLGWLELCNIHYAPCFKEIGDLTRLEVLHLKTSCFRANCEECPLSPPLEQLDLEKCIQLQDLYITCKCLKEFPDLSRLTSLMRVDFRSCNSVREVVGLSSQMSALEELTLFRCPSLYQCHGLGDLVSLQKLVIRYCDQFEQLPDLHKLTNLRQLEIAGVEVAQGFNDSMQLQELVMRRVKDMVDLHLLRHLRLLKIHGFNIQHMMPWFGSFMALEELFLRDLSREVQDLPGIDKLTRLRRFGISNAPFLLQLPRLGDLMALQGLLLSRCCTLVGVAELPDLHNLTNLEALNLDDTPIKSLPGLEHLTQLRSLSWKRATLLTALPDLSALENLEDLDIREWHQLTSLGSVGSMTALRELYVSGCHSLERLPGLRSLKSLIYLHLGQSGVRLLPEDIMSLAALPSLQMFAWDNSEVNFPELLEEMSLAEVVTHFEAKQSEYFTIFDTWRMRVGPDPSLEEWGYLPFCEDSPIRFNISMFSDMLL